MWKSLGGHMRSHLVGNSAEFHEKNECNMKKSSSFHDDEAKFGEFGAGNSQTSYGLRENPRKTWRAADSKLPSPPDQICKQCGKGFHSLKALCGHMACHSEKDKGMKDDYSWTNENDHKMVFDSQSDMESEEMRLRPRSSKTKRYRKVIDEPPVFARSSSVSEIDFLQDPQEVAMCLVLMSRDVSVNNCGAEFDSVVESSDNNSVVMEIKCSSTERRNGRKENMESSDSGYFLDECAKAESDGEVSKSSKRVIMSRKEYDDDDDDDDDAMGSRKRKYGEMWRKCEKKSKYECYNCLKTFKSYQALGGHKPCTKRMHHKIGENSPDGSSTFSKKQKYSKNKSSKNKEQACPFCNRVFKNGQALGGHKRSHFINGGHDDDNINQGPSSKHDLLDLNLPAPEVNEDD